MAKDIRKLFEEERKRVQPSLSEGHEARFLQKLEAQLPQQEKRRIGIIWIRSIAAALVLLIIGWGVYVAWQQSTGTIIEEMPIVENDQKVNTSPSEEESLQEEKTSPPKIANDEIKKDKPQITLSNISPDLKKVEAYFISSINVELANLEVSEEEQEMVDAYLAKVKELGKEYENLNQELNTIGVNDMTITALIENLKLRLQLLQRLKKNLNHSKKETHDKNSVDHI